MAENRQRLRPWLEARINSGDINGLHWLNPEKTIFRIPWKHGGKNDWSQSDSQIFKEWAIHTGRYRDGIDEPEWALWKTRLRCAFNKASDIQELKEQSRNDVDDPFRVYLLQKRDGVNRRMGSQANRTFQQPEGYYRALGPQPGGGIQGVPATVQDIPGSAPIVSLEGIPSNELIYPRGSSPEERTLDAMDIEDHQGDTQNGALMGQQWPVNNDLSYFPVEEMSPPSLGNVIMEAQPFPTDTQTGAPTLHTNQMLISQHATVPIPDGRVVPGHANPQRPLGQQTHVEGHEILVKVFYRSSEIVERVVNNRAGIRLYYGTTSETVMSQMKQEAEKYYGAQDADQVHLPHCTEYIQNQGACELTQRILNSFDRGTVLYGKDGDIYIRRYCRAALYYHHPDIDREPTKLVRSKDTKVFDYQLFEKSLHDHWTGKTMVKPSFHVNLGIGQRWPSTQTVDQQLISAYVISMKAMQMMECYNNQVGSNTTSIEISASDDNDNMIKTLKSLLTM